MKQAESVANPAITTKSGQRARSESGTATLELESVLSSSGDLIDTNLALDCSGKKLTTAFAAKNGEVKFLGAFDSTDKDKAVTCLVFVRVRASK